MKYTRESLLNNSIDRVFLDTVNDEAISCQECKEHLIEICCNMEPKEAKWFRKCAAEIEQYNGHVILVRFLRLYRVFYRWPKLCGGGGGSKT